MSATWAVSECDPKTVDDVRARKASEQGELMASRKSGSELLRETRENTARLIRKQVFIDGCSVPYTKDDDPLWVWAEADPPCAVCLAVERGALNALERVSPVIEAAQQFLGWSEDGGLKEDIDREYLRLLNAVNSL